MSDRKIVKIQDKTENKLVNLQSKDNPYRRAVESKKQSDSAWDSFGKKISQGITDLATSLSELLADAGYSSRASSWKETLWKGAQAMSDVTKVLDIKLSKKQCFLLMGVVASSLVQMAEAGKRDGCPVNFTLHVDERGNELYNWAMESTIPGLEKQFEDVFPNLRRDLAIVPCDPEKENIYLHLTPLKSLEAIVNGTDISFDPNRAHGELEDRKAKGKWYLTRALTEIAAGFPQEVFTSEFAWLAKGLISFFTNVYAGYESPLTTNMEPEANYTNTHHEVVGRFLEQENATYSPIDGNVDPFVKRLLKAFQQNNVTREFLSELLKGGDIDGDWGKFYNQFIEEKEQKQAYDEVAQSKYFEKAMIIIGSVLGTIIGLPLLYKGGRYLRRIRAKRQQVAVDTQA